MSARLSLACVKMTYTMCILHMFMQVCASVLRQLCAVCKLTSVYLQSLLVARNTLLTSFMRLSSRGSLGFKPHSQRKMIYLKRLRMKPKPKKKVHLHLSPRISPGSPLFFLSGFPMDKKTLFQIILENANMPSGISSSQKGKKLQLTILGVLKKFEQCNTPTLSLLLP